MRPRTCSSVISVSSMPRSPGKVPDSRSALSCGVIAWLVSPIWCPLAGGGGSYPGRARARATIGAIQAAQEHAVPGGLLARSPSTALVLGGIASVQFGAALATTLFDRTGPAGTALL